MNATLTLSAPVLVRFPSSHRGRDRAERALGFEPHYWHSFRKDGSFAYIPKGDADRLLSAKEVTRPRIESKELYSCWNQPDVFRNLPAKDERCHHPMSRRTLDPQASEKQEPTDGYCCECGKFLSL